MLIYLLMAIVLGGAGPEGRCFRTTGDKALLHARNVIVPSGDRRLFNCLSALYSINRQIFG